MKDRLGLLESLVFGPKVHDRRQNNKNMYYKICCGVLLHCIQGYFHWLDS